MVEFDATTKRIENARKFALLAQAYPEKTFEQVVAMFQLPAIDINCAVWQLELDGTIGKVTDKSAVIELIHPVFKEDSKHDYHLNTAYFGKEVAYLLNDIHFALENLSRSEGDIEDVYFANWTDGYLAHDLFTAMAYLKLSGKVSSYELTSRMEIDEDSSVYTFYTLTENLGKEWGRKQFEDQTRVESGNTLTPSNAPAALPVEVGAETGVESSIENETAQDAPASPESQPSDVDTADKSS